MATTIHIGTQGWNYEGWVGSFYPHKTSSKDMLSLYAKVFDTVEIDSTFYAIPAENSVRGWYDRTPVGFSFSVKLPSEITHKNRLRDSQTCLESFLQRMLLLREKLACILIQLPPDFSPTEIQSLRKFLKLLPENFQFAIEFRDPKWFTEAMVSELHENHVALTLADGKWVSRQVLFQLVENLQAPFVYTRWLGPRELTDFSRIQLDRTKELAQWSEAFQILAQKTSTIYGYFNNHYQGHSPTSSNDFKRLLNLKIVDPTSLIVQPSLFS
ncbi:MAG: DUF72 domain-containing protein [Acidobacteria bacterium]|nr:DUF72 domain-containing protein [Acidobacteriota bacterium]